MSQLQAVAPEFGVQVRLAENGDICLMANDLGGRGEPHFAALLAVKKNDEGKLLAIDASGQHVVITDAAALSRVRAFLTAYVGADGPGAAAIQTAQSPYLLKVPRKEWPGAPLVLLLLVYIQADGIGGTAGRQVLRRIQATGPERTAAPDEMDAAAAAIGEALDHCDFASLRGGVIAGKLPDASGERENPDCVTFALASCQFPSDILDRMPAGEDARPGPADASLLALAGLMDTQEAPSLLLLAGDQVYVDATKGLFDPKVTTDKFRIPYEIRDQSRGAKAAFQRLDMRVEMMIDDHEIHDNWAPNDPGETPETASTDIRQGRKNYWLYQRGQRNVPPTQPIWFALLHSGLQFFLADTRTKREPRTALIWRTAKIMDDGQWQALEAWLTAPACKDSPKFVLSPSALLPRRLEIARDPECALHSDAWDGYPFSQHKLLQLICDHGPKHLVFLSGDEHISSYTEAVVRKLGTNVSCTFHSIHSSPLYAPYPFGNGAEPDYDCNETFCFPDPKAGPYECHVTSQFAPGDGFAVITACRSSDVWKFRAEFHSAKGMKQPAYCW
jgi:hypothetical protein